MNLLNRCIPYLLISLVALTTAAAADESRLTIILSLRSDFVSQCANYPDLRQLVSQQFQLVGAMEPSDLAKAITLPALEVGAEIDPALVSRILTDMKGEPVKEATHGCSEDARRSPHHAEWRGQEDIDGFLGRRSGHAVRL